MTTDNATQHDTNTRPQHEWEGELLVKDKRIIADAITELTLASPTGERLPEWHPGAHIDLVMRDDLVRQYSLCGDRHDRYSYRVSILKDPNSRGGSQYVHDVIQAGDKLRVRGPRNHFQLVKSPNYLFIAGGIGITPMLPMIHAAEAAGANWQLLYGGRSRKSMAYLDDLATYGDCVQLFAENEVGRIPINQVLEQAQDETRVYVCGPSALIDAVEAGVTHWPPGSLHSERFTAKPVTAAQDALDTFKVVCQRSGITLTVGAEESILDVMAAAGIKVQMSCRAGVCGSCEVDILEGEAEHRDSVLTPEERASNEFMLVCCSRSRTPVIVLDA